MRSKLVYLVVFALCSPLFDSVSAKAQDLRDAGGRTYEDLTLFFRDWRAFQRPRTISGVPDYGTESLKRQHEGLRSMYGRLGRIDTTGWTISQRVDYVLIWAEMNGLDFDHRVLRPWVRHPGFYATFFPYRSDVPAHEGSVADAVIDVWTYSFPLSSADERRLAGQLKVIPALLSQAKVNLTGNARDLWSGGIRRFKEQSSDLETLAGRTRNAGLDLQESIAEARKATDAFTGWLEERLPLKQGPSGVGKDNYTWYLQKVHLMPLTWEDEVTIMRRELARAHAALLLEEHRNRELPLLPPVQSAPEYDRAHARALASYMRFLHQKEILTVKEYMEPALREQLGAYSPGPLSFFSEVDVRDAVIMRTHGHHWIELARSEREPHASPVRQVPLLYNIFDGRAEGLATGMEEMMMHAGLFDSSPRSRELIWVLLAQRAARALGGLHMHSNDWTMEQAVDFATSRTPRGWLSKEGSLVWFEQDLYLQQPEYGSSYITGKLEIEKLMTELTRTWGTSFTMKGFMDSFASSGIIPVSLIRWEMTGDDEEVRRMTEN